MADGATPSSGGALSFFDQLKNAKASTGPNTVAEAKSRGVWGTRNSDCSANSQGKTNINACSRPRKYDYKKSKPSLQELQKDWGPNATYAYKGRAIFTQSPGYEHDYVVPDTVSTAEICSHAVLACKTTNVHESTVATNVPGNTDAYNNAIRPAKMAGRSAGDVVVIDEGNNVTNVTRPGHILYYGYIERTIIDKPDGIYLSVHGHGINKTWAMARANEQVGYQLFKDQNLVTRNYFETHFGPSGADSGSGYQNGPFTNSP